jgi:transposase
MTFSEADVQVLAHQRYHHLDPRVQRYLEILWLKHHGLAHDRSATLAAVSRSIVQRCRAAYHHGGLARIRAVAPHPSHSARDDQRATLEAYFTQCPPRSVKQAQDAIENRTGIRRGQTQVRQFLPRLGLEPRKVAALPMPPPFTVAEHVEQQKEFLEEKLGSS